MQYPKSLLQMVIKSVLWFSSLSSKLLASDKFRENSHRAERDIFLYILPLRVLKEFYRAHRFAHDYIVVPLSAFANYQCLLKSLAGS